MNVAKISNIVYRISSIMGFLFSVMILAMAFDTLSVFTRILMIIWTLLSSISVLRIVAEVITKQQSKQQRFKQMFQKWTEMFDETYKGYFAYGILMIVGVLFKLAAPFFISGI